ncbi:winged helix-turn-helix transcriptional regulator [Pontibacter locisalis]|uniref:Winged helix-turn-helix transcriptional regulator n=1 Tax=Pontibacter locisalis TaxID=1719035 RepID=A0ABW5IFE4_9BACT
MGVTKAEDQRVRIQKKIEKVLTARQEEEQCCPVKDILARFGDKWSIYAILMLGKHETLRFNELKGLIAGISQRMLTVTLRALEEDGLVNRNSFPEIPPRVEYSLTSLGQSLLLQLLKLADWAKLNIHQILEARERYNKK